MLIYTTPDRILANYLQSELQQHSIYTVVFEKKANMYIADLRPPEFEIYTHFRQAEEALEIIYNITE